MPSVLHLQPKSKESERSNAPKRAESRAPAARVVRLAAFDSDAAIVRALREGRREGGIALYDRYQAHVRRILTRVLGPDAALTDLSQEVFIAAITGVGRLVDPDALRSWLSGICVNVAQSEIRRRRRSRWLSLFDPTSAPEPPPSHPEPELRQAVHKTYEILNKLPAKERIPFALRYLEGMELVEVAEACDVSLATIKRRLSRARERFLHLASAEPELAEWVEAAS